MSRNSNRYGIYKSTRLPHDKRSILIPGSLEDSGRYYKCWNCGATCDSQREQSDTGAYATSGVQVASNLSLLLNMDGDNGSTTFTDSSPNAHTVTANGTAAISTAQYKFGDSCGVFDGSTAYLSIPDSAVFDFSGGTWMIDFWSYQTYVSDANEGIYLHQTSPADSFNIYFTKTSPGYKVTLECYASSVKVINLYTTTDACSYSAWHHIKVTGFNYIYTIYVDGGLAVQNRTEQLPADYTGEVKIGASPGYLNGYLDDFRVMKYVDTYGTFAVPTSAYDADTYIPGAYYPDVNGGCWFCGSRNYR